MTHTLRDLLLLVILLQVLPVLAQSEVPEVRVEPAESLAATAGLSVDRQRWHFGEQSGWAWRAWLRLPGRVEVTSSDDIQGFERFLPLDPGPWASINGGFYDVDGVAMGLVVSDGITHSPYRRGGGSGIFEVRAEGPRIIHHSGFEPGAIEALQSIDRIVADGRSLVNPRPEARRAARAGVGISDRFVVFVLLADDQSMLPGSAHDVRLHDASSHGLPLWAFARYFQNQVGARDALNLDGSVSAQFAARVGDTEIRIHGMRGTVNALVMRP